MMDRGPSCYTTNSNASTTYTAIPVVQRFIAKQINTRLTVEYAVKSLKPCKKAMESLMALFHSTPSSWSTLSRDSHSNRRSGLTSNHQGEITAGLQTMLLKEKLCWKTLSIETQTRKTSWLIQSWLSRTNFPPKCQQTLPICFWFNNLIKIYRSDHKETRNRTCAIKRMKCPLSYKLKTINKWLDKRGQWTTTHTMETMSWPCSSLRDSRKRLKNTVSNWSRAYGYRDRTTLCKKKTTRLRPRKKAWLSRNDRSKDSRQRCTTCE